MILQSQLGEKIGTGVGEEGGQRLRGGSGMARKLEAMRETRDFLRL